MEQPRAVDRLDRTGDGLEQSGRVERGVRDVQPVVERPARDILEDQVQPAIGLADVVESHHVLVPQQRERPAFAEPPGVFVRPRRRAAAHDLERHQPAEIRLPRQVDDAHAPPAQLALDHEAGDLGRFSREQPAIRVGRIRSGIVPPQPVQPVLAVGTVLDMVFDRGQGVLVQPVGPQPGQGGGGRARNHRRSPNSIPHRNRTDAEEPRITRIYTNKYPKNLGSALARDGRPVVSSTRMPEPE